MTAMRMMIWIGAGLLIGSLACPATSADEPPQSRREREIQAAEAKREAEKYRAELDEARRHYEQAEQRYSQLTDRYDEAKSAYALLETAYRLQSRHGASLKATEAQVAELENRLHGLRLREVELQATIEQLSVAGRPKEAEHLQQEMIELHRQTQMTMLELEQQHRELDRVRERREIGYMQDRLDFIGHWRDVAFDPQQAVMMATQSIVETHVATGDVISAVQVLEDLLEKIEWLGARTALRFALKDLYGEMEQPERVQDQMIHVILENAGGHESE